MPRKAAITETSLKSLGLKRLAALVHEACDRDDVLEKKVRMMLAAKDGGDALDAELAKRIKGLATARTFYDWREAGDLVRTIDDIRANITDELAGKDPDAAVARLWQLIEAANTIMQRVDDSSGMVADSLQGVVADLGLVRISPVSLMPPLSPSACTRTFSTTAIAPRTGSCRQLRRRCAPRAAPPCTSTSRMTSLD